jgi:hypothetical protein
VREDQILPHLAAISILLAGRVSGRGRGDCGPGQVTGPADTAALIDQLRDVGVVLSYHPDDRTLHTGDHDALSVTIGKDRSHRNRGREAHPEKRETEHPPRPEAEHG